MHTNLTCCTFNIADISGFKQKVLNWLRPFSTFCFLDNQGYHMPPHQAEMVVAAGVKQYLEGNEICTADALFARPKWLFGHLSYELKNTLHHLPSHKTDRIGFSPFYFFEPEVVMVLKENRLTIYSPVADAVFAAICKQPPTISVKPSSPVLITPRLTKAAYLAKIKALQSHILRGDCYEINFCQEFFAEATQVEPFALFQHLMAVSPNPFSAFYRLNDKFLLCASPERFLARKGQLVLSQPMKGTMPRNLKNKEHDKALKISLSQSPKEQAENVMVVDLVRNDLTKICQPASVKVDELFGVYSFPQVHQMISTVSGQLKREVGFSEIIEATFPMGSMTGAPKQRVMELIEQYEPVARGIFSGAVGYKSPTGDFDFNVVIRSIMYNQVQRYLSYQVGSGITFYSDAEKEWEECMLKADAIRQVLFA